MVIPRTKRNSFQSIRHRKGLGKVIGSLFVNCFIVFDRHFIFEKISNPHIKEIGILYVQTSSSQWHNKGKCNVTPFL